LDGGPERLDADLFGVEEPLRAENGGTLEFQLTDKPASGRDVSAERAPAYTSSVFSRVFAETPFTVQ
jgi:hypothetical protein